MAKIRIEYEGDDGDDFDSIYMFSVTVIGLGHSFSVCEKSYWFSSEEPPEIEILNADLRAAIADPNVEVYLGDYPLGGNDD